MAGPKLYAMLPDIRGDEAILGNGEDVEARGKILTPAPQADPSNSSPIALRGIRKSSKERTNPRSDK